MKSVYKCDLCGNTEIYDDGASHCAKCGGKLTKVIDGEAKLKDTLRKFGIYMEGFCTVPLFVAVSKLNTEPGAALGAMVGLLVVMSTVIPFATGMIKVRRPKKHKKSAWSAK